MILSNFFFKKERQKNESEKSALMRQLYQAREENKSLERRITFFKAKQKRIEYLLNQKVKKNTCCVLEQTAKGVEVMSVVGTFDYSGQVEIEIFDLIAPTHNTNRQLVLWARKEAGNLLYIQDIQGGVSKGHGEVAMHHLIEVAGKELIKKIHGKLSPVDFGHLDRLQAFYQKMNFEIIADENGRPTGVEKKLPKYTS